MKIIHVHLIGRQCADNMNLGLAYLAAALEQAQISHTVHMLNDWREIEPIGKDILEAGSGHLVGLSLPDGGSALLPLALGEWLSRKGYIGHITCGGAFATLARQWLLERYAWLDSVVRFAGEVPLVTLARASASAEDLSHVPGLTTRQGDGLPAPVLDDAPLSITPVRDHFPQILGHPMAHITASRGCQGRCSYCGPAAILSQERREGRALGAPRERLNAAGVGGVKRRKVEALCDEMAGLWHEKAVRYFYFVDEHMLPYEEDEALSYLHRLREGLVSRGMERWGIGTMLRAEHLSQRVLEAFSEAGLVRIFLGVELASAIEAKRFGRKVRLDHAMELLSSFRELGIATISNLMVLHPYSTPKSIQDAITFLDRIPTGSFEATRMMVYHGTGLHQRMQREGRLLGNPLRYSYAFSDEIVKRFEEIFCRLRAESFGDYSLAFRAHDAELAWSLGRRLYPKARLGPLENTIDDLRRKVNRLYVEALRMALDLAIGGDGFFQANDLVRDVALRASVLAKELETLTEEIPAIIHRPSRIFSPMRAAASSTIHFVVLGAALSWSCSSHSVPDSMDANITESGSLADKSISRLSDISRERPFLPNDGWMQMDKIPLADGPVCSAQEVALEEKLVLDKVSLDDPCFSGVIDYQASARQIENLPYSVHSLFPCQTSEMQTLMTNKETALGQAIDPVEQGCLKGKIINVQGGAVDDLEQMGQILEKACGYSIWSSAFGIMIVLDASGKVQGVVAQPGTNPDPMVLDCIKTALGQLSFPCLANYQICPEYIITE
jgi:radical SAM superfamily enzyme YgiQ (UPF0313 family)